LNLGLELARLAVYHLSHFTVPFALVIFKTEFHIMSGLTWTAILLLVLPRGSWNDRHTPQGPALG
jgi:ABC-type molybdate transport system permease subunit